MSLRKIIEFMSFIGNIYDRITESYWAIGFIENKLEDVINGTPLRYVWVKNHYKDRWFADPFVLDVDEKYIYLLVEEYTYAHRKGLIVKLTIDRELLIITKREEVLETDTHLSFPIIERKQDRLFIYPENYKSGKLSLYEFLPKENSCNKLRTLCHAPVTDAVCCNYFGDKLLFSTTHPNDNGSVLDIYRWNKEQETYIFDASISFKENIARNAGDFFKINENVYRPAQECNFSYGHALSIQAVQLDEQKQWNFKEVRRITSPNLQYPLGIHTFNHYKGVIVVDALAYRWKTIACIASCLRSLIKKIKAIF